MNEADINVNVAKLKNAVAAENEEAAAETAITLLEGFLVNVARIAAAAETLAQRPRSP